MMASIITALFLTGMMTSKQAATFLFIYGAFLLVAEAGVASFGMLALNGLLAMYVGYAIQTGDNMVFGILIDWPLIFGIAFVELAAIAISVYVFLKYRGERETTGAEGMIGGKAVVIEWNGTKGNVLIQGENWRAVSDKALELDKDEEVIIEAVDGLTLKISA